MKKIEVKRSKCRWLYSDRTLASRGPARPVMCSSEDAGVGQMTGRWVAQRPDAGRLRSVMLTWQHRGRHRVTGRWLYPVKHDWTWPVEKNCFWKLTGNDRTLGVQRPITL